MQALLHALSLCCRCWIFVFPAILHFTSTKFKYSGSMQVRLISPLLLYKAKPMMHLCDILKGLFDIFIVLPRIPCELKGGGRGQRALRAKHALAAKRGFFPWGGQKSLKPYISEWELRVLSTFEQQAPYRWKLSSARIIIILAWKSAYFTGMGKGWKNKEHSVHPYGNGESVEWPFTMLHLSFSPHYCIFVCSELAKSMLCNRGNKNKSNTMAILKITCPCYISLNASCQFISQCPFAKAERTNP